MKVKPFSYIELNKDSCIIVRYNIVEKDWKPVSGILPKINAIELLQSYNEDQELVELFFEDKSSGSK